MSTQKNQIVSVWKDVEEYLRRIALRFRGQPLTTSHQALVRDAYVLTFLAWRDLLLGSGFSPYTVDMRWVNSLATADVRTVFSFLKDADKLLLATVDDEGWSYSRFKREMRKTYPFSGDILSPLKGPFVAWFADKEPSTFSALHGAFAFPSRLNLPGLNEIEREALEDYLLREQTLRTDGFDSPMESALISQWFPKKRLQFYFSHFEGSHGPGAVADGTTDVASKYKHMGTDPWIHYLDLRLGDKIVLPRERCAFERTACVRLVPKTLLSYRSISMEPTTLMWYQQGFLRAFVADLEDPLRAHPLRRRFHPAYQDPNREQAWLGSVDGSMSTIDLSAASDSVAWGLVKSWFTNSCWFPIMCATRSKNVKLPSGELLAVKKYAPMGSALCFPTECIVFAAVVESAIKEAGGDPNKSNYRVYGDDIVVETSYADTVMSRLRSFGFVVNTTKSFFNSGSHHFRESCGGEFLDGDDVTPVRLSRWFSGLSVDAHHPGTILSLIELANDVYMRLPNVRRRVVAALLTLPARLVPLFDSSGEQGIFSVQPTNWRMGVSHYVAAYQRNYVAHGGISTRRTPTVDIDEDIRLYEYLRLSQGRDRLTFPEDRVEANVSATLSAQWTGKRSPEDDLPLT